MSQEFENFVIVDANAFVHSSFHGYPEKLDRNGNDQKVLYGLMNTLVDLSNKIPNITNIYMIFDPSDSSLYRKSIFPSYKANRPPTDPNLAKQREEAKKVLIEHLGILSLSYPGYEADDIIGSLSNHVKNDNRVVLVSPDKDIAQLVDKNVIFLRRFKNKTERGYKLINTDNILNEFGVQSNQIPDLLALMGDSADNLPGLYKIGIKKAAEILNKYQSIEHLLSILDFIDDKELVNKVKNNEEQLRLVKNLATIVTDLDIKDLVEKSLHKSYRIRTHSNYLKKLEIIKNHYNWPESFIEILK